ncbi:ABC transporter substrate-binding protein [Actinomycetes bacterium KLBMP 9759]
MHRLATFGLAAAGTALLLLTSACAGGAPGAASDARTLTLQTNWTTGGQENVPLTAALKQFTAQTGITVKVLENGDDLNEVYATSLLAGKEADVLLVGLLEKQLDWVENGAVVPLEEYVGPWGLTDELPVDAVDDWTDQDGHLRGFPYAGFTWPWWYNTELLAQHGATVPTTTEELVATAAKLRAGGVEPVVVGGNDWSGQKIFLQFLQTYLSPADAVKVFNEGDTCANPDALRGIELFTQLRDAGVFAEGVEGLSADQAQAMYFSGTAAIAPLGSWAYLAAPEERAAATVLGGLPAAPGGTYAKPTAFRGSTSAGWWISPNGKEKIESVRKLITFMYQPQVLHSMLVDGGVVLSTATRVDTGGVTSPLLAQSFDDLPAKVDFAVMPDLHVPADVSNPMYRATSIAYTKGNDTRKICETVDAVYRSVR